MNPFQLILAILAAVGLLIGGIMTALAMQGEVPGELGQLAGPLLTLGVVAAIGALVLAGSEWRARQQR